LCLPNLTGGTTFYDIVNHYDVTLNSVASGYGFQTSTRRGGFNRAVNLDGMSGHDAKRTTSVPISGLPCTLACWFNLTTKTADNALMGIDSGSNANSIAMELLGSISKVGAFLNNATSEVYSSTAISGTGVWNFATTTFVQGTQYAYLNGASKSSAGSDASTPTGLTTLRLGGFWGSNWLTGYIDCCMVYNRALSDAEVLQLYLETSKQCPALLRRVNRPRIFYPTGTAVVTPPIGVLTEFNQSVKSASFF